MPAAIFDQPFSSTTGRRQGNFKRVVHEREVEVLFHVGDGGFGLIALGSSQSRRVNKT
jgi:hypothetical protein